MAFTERSIMDINYFHGQQNLNAGNRRGQDKILPEILDEISTAANAGNNDSLDTRVTALETADLDTRVTTLEGANVKAVGEQTGTGAEQTIAHTLGRVPTAVVVVPTEIPVAGWVVTEGTHTETNLKLTVTLAAKYKVLVL
jgi:hypothetical protein